MNTETRLRWRTRLLVWGGAIAAGLAVVAFSQAAVWAQAGFHRLAAFGAWVPFVLTPAVGMAVVWMMRHGFPGTGGSGVPQAIAAIHLAAGDKEVGHLVSPRIALGKVLLVCLGLLGGFSVGIEAPAVQVAASLLVVVYGLLPTQHARAAGRGVLVLAGGGAGVAAVFNTPIAGVLFAIEVLAGRRPHDANIGGIILTVVVVAGLVAIGLLGNYAYFGRFNIGEVGGAIAVPVIVCGVACGVLGGLFSRLLLLPYRHPDWRLWRWRAAHPVAFAGICGLAMAAIGWASAGTAHGTGYDATAAAVAGTATLAWYEPFTKLAATVVSYFSGIPGGTFAPAIAIGAAAGFDLAGPLAAFGAPHQIVALATAAFLAATIQAPLTAAVIVMEMVDSHGLALGLMVTALIAKAVGSALGPDLYHEMAAALLGADEKGTKH